MQPSSVSICLMVSLIGLIAGDVRGGEKLGFFEAPFVHPALVECLAGDLSDRHPSIVALDLEEAQGSNQIAGARDFAIILPEGDKTGTPWIQISTQHENGETTYFKYRAIRKDPDGTVSLECYSWGGGSGYWSHHMAVRIVDQTQIRYDEKDQPYRHSYQMLKLVGFLPVGIFER